MLREGLPAKKAATDADDTRYDFRNLVTCNADGSPRGGVTSPVGVNLLAATASMNVAIQPFSAFAVRDGGVVLLANDGVTNLLLDAPPSSNSRIDVIWAKQDDSSSTVTTPDGDDLPVFGFLKGTAAPTPVRNPAGIPQGAVEVGSLLIPSTATATNSGGVVFSQSAPFTAAPGGSVPFRTKAELDLWTTARYGQEALVFADSTTAYRRAWFWNGTAWTHSLNASVPFAMAAGSGSNPGGASAAVTFPAGRFTVAPLVTMANTGSTVSAMNASSITTSGANMGGYNAAGSAIATNFMWVAVQMTATSAAG